MMETLSRLFLLASVQLASLRIKGYRGPEARIHRDCFEKGKFGFGLIMIAGDFSAGVAEQKVSITFSCAEVCTSNSH